MTWTRYSCLFRKLLTNCRPMPQEVYVPAPDSAINTYNYYWGSRALYTTTAVRGSADTILNMYALSPWAAEIDTSDISWRNAKALKRFPPPKMVKCHVFIWEYWTYQRYTNHKIGDIQQTCALTFSSPSPKSLDPCLHFEWRWREYPEPKHQ